MVRLGIIGFGWVARDFALPAIAGMKGCTLAAIADPKAEGVPEGTSVFAAVDDLVATGLCDAVYVASPNHLHEEHVVAALRSGLHVLCEKPLALTEDAARRMASAARESGRVLVTAFDQRHHPAHRTMRAMVEAGRIGRVTQVRIDYACWVGADFAADNWRIDRDRAGGGAVVDLAPHGLDLVEFLTGEPITDLRLLMQSKLHCYGVDDGGVLAGRTSGGALASLTVAYNRNEALPRRRLEVFGEHGALFATDTMGQDAGGRLTLLHAEDGESEVAFDGTSPFTSQFDAFIGMVERGRSPRDPSEDARLVGLLERALAEDTTWR